MRIEIRRGMENVIIISFHRQFDSEYERSKFFRELHGWNQTVPRNNKRYSYHRRGLLDEIPHAKIADSVFMTAMENMQRIEEFFKHWQEHVDYEILEAMMKKKFVEERL